MLGDLIAWCVVLGALGWLLWHAVTAPRDESICPDCNTVMTNQYGCSFCARPPKENTP